MFNRNPTIIISGLSGLLQQVLPLLVILGWLHLTSEQLAAVISLQGLLLTFIATTILRSQVTPNDTANQQMIIARAAESTTPIAKIKEQADAVVANS